MPIPKARPPSHWTFAKPNEVWVYVSPCSIKAWKEPRIALDGRNYICGGRLFLPCGVELRASFEVQTRSFDYLERNTVYVELGDFYYLPEEPELAEALGTTREGVIPYTWIPDRPLACSDPGPYAMSWYQRIRKGRVHGKPPKIGS